MKRKVIATVLALCVTAGLLAGCGAPEPDEVETTEEAAPEAEEETAAEEQKRQGKRVRKRKAALTE